MKHARMRTAAIILVALLAAPFSIAQSPSCSDEKKSREFDFWIGEWNVFAQDKQAGVNSIRPILDGCVLQETWQGAGGSAGSSFNFYNPQTGKWHQFWVWRNGTTLDLSGGLADGRMILSGESESAEGERVMNRITWTPNEDGTVRQLWEQSTDGGKSWAVSFDGLYRKKKS